MKNANIKGVRSSWCEVDQSLTYCLQCRRTASGRKNLPTCSRKWRLRWVWGPVDARAGASWGRDLFCSPPWAFLTRMRVLRISSSILGRIPRRTAGCTKATPLGEMFSRVGSLALEKVAGHLHSGTTKSEVIVAEKRHGKQLWKSFSSYCHSSVWKIVEKSTISFVSYLERNLMKNFIPERYLSTFWRTSSFLVWYHYKFPSWTLKFKQLKFGTSWTISEICWIFLNSLIAKKTNQPINQSNNQSINKSIDQSIDQCLNWINVNVSEK